MRGPQILLIGDDRALCHPVSGTLWGLGYGVDVAYNASTGLFLASRRPYSHIVIEHELQEADGVTLFRHIHRLQKDLIGILVTAAANLNTVYDAIEAGMRRVLAKPVDYDQLLPILQPKEDAMQATAAKSGSFNEEWIGGLSLYDIQEGLTKHELIEMIRSVDYPFAGKQRLEHFDRDTLERVAHLVCRWCRQRRSRGLVRAS